MIYAPKTVQAQVLGNERSSLIVPSLIFLLFAPISFYFWKYQRQIKQERENNIKFTKKLLESAEKERLRVSNDLHESINHELLSLKTNFKQDAVAINNKIDTIINDIRVISRNLHPVMFDKIGLLPNIEQLVETLQNQHGLMISTEIEYSNCLNSGDELQLYRIIQEAFSNIVKYANAHAAKITMTENRHKIFLEIKDNGRGFNVKDKLNGEMAFGLRNIIERSYVIGGEAHIQSSSSGTVISIEISK